MNEQVPKKKQGFIKKLLKGILYIFIASFIYLVICTFIFPPITLTQVGALVTGKGLKRDYVGWDEISPNIKLAAIASEDQLFPDHNGFDWKAIDKSLHGDQRKRKRKRAKGAAASTISQQTAKNVFLWQGAGFMKYVRKAPEVIYTSGIELAWGKKRILEVYLNVIEMGSGIFGVEAASRRYFGKSAKNLTRAEAAMIIASLPNPKKYTVKPMSRWVRWRHNGIMRQMSNIESDPDVQALIR